MRGLMGRIRLNSAKVEIEVKAELVKVSGNFFPWQFLPQKLSARSVTMGKELRHQSRRIQYQT